MCKICDKKQEVSEQLDEILFRFQQFGVEVKAKNEKQQMVCKDRVKRLCEQVFMDIKQVYQMIDDELAEIAERSETRH